ncbi:MAG: nuclear transport factor 2 family protein [Halieaceae bacterium]
MSDTADELAIRDLVARYIDAVNRHNQDDWAATWSENASWNLVGMEVSGRQAIVELWVGAMSGFDFALMMLNSGTVQINGDSATGRWYVTEHLKPCDGDANTTLGVYEDEYAKENGEWVFTRRQYHIMCQGAADSNATFTPYRPD